MKESFFTYLYLYKGDDFSPGDYVVRPDFLCHSIEIVRFVDGLVLFMQRGSKDYTEKSSYSYAEKCHMTHEVFFQIYNSLLVIWLSFGFVASYFIALFFEILFLNGSVFLNNLQSSRFSRRFFSPVFAAWGIITNEITWAFHLFESFVVLFFKACVYLVPQLLCLALGIFELTLGTVFRFIGSLFYSLFVISGLKNELSVTTGGLESSALVENNANEVIYVSAVAVDDDLLEAVVLDDVAEALVVEYDSESVASYDFTAAVVVEDDSESIVSDDEYFTAFPDFDFGSMFFS